MIGLLKSWTGSFLGGLYFVAGLMLLSALLTLLLAHTEARKTLAVPVEEP
jgi:ACS family tartrate transporter-like MFS transporter